MKTKTILEKAIDEYEQATQDLHESTRKLNDSISSITSKGQESQPHLEKQKT